MNPHQEIITWLRTGIQGPSKPNREMAADCIEHLRGSLAVEQEQARGREIEYHALRRERDDLRAKVAEFERVAAIGRRAVGMLNKHCRYLGESVGEVAAEWCLECDNSGACADDCELAAILRDAEQAGMGVES